MEGAEKWIRNTVTDQQERGMQNSGSDYALACYQLLETAIAEAEVWEVSFANIGLEGFDTGQLPRVSDCRTA